ncbi:hypothetical protein K439DRAFT_1390119 [Ramaria rubella]|nr:hypothetical protein K439DRAFT_1390119 [Ramaria rubella]
MSAYGPSPPRHGPLLPSKHFTLLPKSTSFTASPGTALTASVAPRVASPPASSLSVHHLTSATIPPSLADHLYVQFQAELERGNTYPQEYPMTRTAFDAYFLGNDVFVGVVQFPNYIAVDCTLNEARGDREWEQCVGGAYYIKPNYPGRSSHICNAGFFVIPQFRGIGIATALAQSYLKYAPRLGYKASVFNLVYVNNVASVRIWDRLGFNKVGRLPCAGRLKRRAEEGGGEEYVDAWVMYKSFEGDDGDSNVLDVPP